MSNGALVISKGTLKKDQLTGYNILITGAGGGIGFEAARSLLWMGARVIIAEVDKEAGKNAETELNQEFGENRAFFVHTDIGSEKSVKRLAEYIFKNFGKLDVLFNNATIAPIGAVHTVGIEKWDMSYNVNLKGPVMLISHFLPDMLKRNSGIVVFVPSSGAAPYMGAYEVFKTSQVELCNTLAGELEGTQIVTYSIGPGIVKTETAQKAISEIAPLYGKSVEEFYNMNKSVLISAEEAGAGFAASIALASGYAGLEIGSIQALTDAGIQVQEQKSDTKTGLSDDEKNSFMMLINKISTTFCEQVDGWYKRMVFERQWVLRDFKKYAGAAPEHFIEELKKLETSLQNNELPVMDYDKLPFIKLHIYYLHQMDLLKGYEKKPEKLKENLSIMDAWLKDINDFKELYGQAVYKLVGEK
jgi:NAD(P)-dependent dehydrogenase (short-subunit alcohol dehydrogenase family)